MSHLCKEPSTIRQRPFHFSSGRPWKDVRDRQAATSPKSHSHTKYKIVETRPESWKGLPKLLWAKLARVIVVGRSTRQFADTRMQKCPSHPWGPNRLGPCEPNERPWLRLPRLPWQRGHFRGFSNERRAFQNQPKWARQALPNRCPWRQPRLPDSRQQIE